MPKVCQRTTGGVDSEKSGQREEWTARRVDSGRSGQREEWTARGVDSERSGQREKWTARVMAIFLIERSGQREKWTARAIFLIVFFSIFLFKSSFYATSKSVCVGQREQWAGASSF